MSWNHFLRSEGSGSKIRILGQTRWSEGPPASQSETVNPGRRAILLTCTNCAPTAFSPFLDVGHRYPPSLHSQSLTQLLRRTKQLRQLSPCCCPPRPHTDAPEIQFWTYSSEIFSRLSDGRMYFFVLANFCISCLCKSIFVRGRVSSPTHVDRPPRSSWSWKASPAFTFSFNAFLYFTLLSTSYFFFFTFRPTFFL